MIYLASPYSHPSPQVREARFVLVREATLRLLQTLVVFSPIVYSHQFSAFIGTDFSAWQTFDNAMIDAAKELWVLKIDGWETSNGVWNEIEHAKATGKPVKYIDPNTLTEDTSHHTN
jgi:hypothetical protein